MEQVSLGYSTKNIPLPKNKVYQQKLIESMEKFVRSIRWRSFFFLNPTTTTSKKETFGFNSTKSPPNIPELKEFEEGLVKIAQSVKFNKVTNDFQKQLRKDSQEIRNNNKLLIPADKTNNFYKLQPDTYDQLLHNNITKDYKKAPQTAEKQITAKDKTIASNLDLDDRINITAQNQAFITLKDHKQNFTSNPKCRLINPTKSEIGKVSKHILTKINSKTRSNTKLNQWKNTEEVITWYKNIPNKHKQSFICFDVCEFYPSITEELLHKALNFAKSHTTITEQDKQIIIQAKKSLLYNTKTPWCKKTNADFDVTMGSFDGAETCELVGLYILHQLRHLGINIGLYRDDGLAACDKTPKQIDKIKKEICKIFDQNKLKITIDANLKTVDFLDITMDMRTGEHKPYTKPNNTPLYVHKDSNHPPNIIKNIPESINKRLSNISSNENVFKQASQPYQEALQKSGYNYTLTYKPTQANTNNQHTSRKNNRKRNITWFNPPYSKHVATHIGKKFIHLLNTCFPTTHKLHKLLNKNTVKISYSCMPNMKHIISTHNKTTITKKENPANTTTKNCNCRRNNPCPLNGLCQTPEIIYQATVTRQDNNNKETYIGLTSNTFKTRYNAHTSSFNNNRQRNATTLSRHIWSLKDSGTEYEITWKIVDRGKPYSPASKRCNLCLKEKLYIICKPEMSTLNNRNELASKCRHKDQFLLCNTQTP